jgi:hypothetical protein
VPAGVAGLAFKSVRVSNIYSDSVSIYTCLHIQMRDSC